MRSTTQQIACSDSWAKIEKKTNQKQANQQKQKQQQKQIRQMFLKLVRIDEQGQIIPHYQPLALLKPTELSIEKTLELLKLCNKPPLHLLELRETQLHGVLVSLSSDLLITHWCGLQSWLTQQQQEVAFLQWIEESAQRWKQHKKTRRFLWKKSADFELLDQQYKHLRPRLTPLQNDFITASKFYQQRNTALKASVLVISLFACFGFGWLSYQQQQQMEHTEAARMLIQRSYEKAEHDRKLAVERATAKQQSVLQLEQELRGVRRQMQRLQQAEHNDELITTQSPLPQQCTVAELEQQCQPEGEEQQSAEVIQELQQQLQLSPSDVNSLLTVV